MKTLNLLKISFFLVIYGCTVSLKSNLIRENRIRKWEHYQKENFEVVLPMGNFIYQENQERSKHCYQMSRQKFNNFCIW